jgi:hypothetical protein
MSYPITNKDPDFYELAELIFRNCPEDKLSGRWSRLDISLRYNLTLSEILDAGWKEFSPALVETLLFKFQYAKRHYVIRQEYLVHMLKKIETDPSWIEWFDLTDDISNELQRGRTPFTLMCDDYDYLVGALYTGCANIALNPENYYIIHEEEDVYEIRHIDD